jgi:predicted Holliday junction resolvase-like endonuclease
VVIINNFIVFVVILLVIVLILIVYRLGQSRKELEWRSKLEKIRREVADKQRAGIKGKVAETFAPYLGDFPFKPSECKFLGDPIDYIVFEGLDHKDVTGIHFVDVKTDSAELKKHQKQIKEIVESGKNLSFTTFRFKTH